VDKSGDDAPSVYVMATGHYDPLEAFAEVDESGHDEASAIAIERADEDDPLEAFDLEPSHLEWDWGPAILPFDRVFRPAPEPDADGVIHRLPLISWAGFVSVAVVLVAAGISSWPTGSVEPYDSHIRRVPTDKALAMQGLEELRASLPPPTPDIAAERLLHAPMKERASMPTAVTSTARVAAVMTTGALVRTVSAQTNLPRQAQIRSSGVNSFAELTADLDGQDPPATLARTLTTAEARSSVERDAIPLPLPVRPPWSAASEDVVSAPGATVNASREPSAPTALSPSHDENAIRSVVGQYRSAFSSLDVAAAAAAWPTVDRRALVRAFSQLSEQSFDFNGCEISVNGQLGAASCTGQARFVPKIGSRTPQRVAREWNFTLRKSSDDWVIDTVQSR
jgi:hypothetical protein